MSKAVVVSNKASGEIQKAAVWYDRQSWELSTRFIDVLDYYFNRISKYPAIYKKVDKDVSRCLMKIFPYVIFFSETPNEIVILRVRHTKQKPLKRYR